MTHEVEEGLGQYKVHGETRIHLKNIMKSLLHWEILEANKTVRRISSCIEKKRYSTQKTNQQRQVILKVALIVLEWKVPQ